MRLYVLRTTYLVLVVGLGTSSLPELISHEPTARGVIPSVLGGIWLVAFLGIRYPLQMVTLLLFELVWKTVWLLDYGLPQWISGHAPATFAGDFKAIAAGVILMPLGIPWCYVIIAIVIPWGSFWRHYVKRPGAKPSRSTAPAPLRTLVHQDTRPPAQLPPTPLATELATDSPRVPTARPRGHGYGPCPPPSPPDLRPALAAC